MSFWLVTSFRMKRCQGEELLRTAFSHHTKACNMGVGNGGGNEWTRKVFLLHKHVNFVFLRKCNCFTWNWTHEGGGTLCQVYVFEMEQCKDNNVPDISEQGSSRWLRECLLRSLPGAGWRHRTAVLPCPGLLGVTLLASLMDWCETLVSPWERH